MSNFQYKHIIWDWNGTLFDDAWLCVDIINEVLQKRGLSPVTPDDYQRLFGFPLIDYYRKLGFDFTLEPFEAISTEFILEYEKRRSACQLRPGALDVLGHHAQNGVTQSILSASKQSFLDEAIDHFNIANFFIGVNGLDNHHASGKIEIGQQWVAELDLEASKIVLIGDTVHDYEVAGAIGVDCWLIPSGHQDFQRLTACEAEVIESLFEIKIRSGV